MKFVLKLITKPRITAREINIAKDRVPDLLYVEDFDRVDYYLYYVNRELYAIYKILYLRVYLAYIKSHLTPLENLTISEVISGEIGHEMYYQHLHYEYEPIFGSTRYRLMTTIDIMLKQSLGSPVVSNNEDTPLPSDDQFKRVSTAELLSA